MSFLCNFVEGFGGSGMFLGRRGTSKLHYSNPGL
jgi:hypothetical protein